MKRALVIGVAAFAALLVAVLATRETKVSEGVQRLSVPRVSKDAFTEVVLSGAKSATLKKGPDGWKVQDPAKPDVSYPSDPTQVNPLLEALAKIGTADFVTERPEKHVEYEVDLGNGQRVKASTASGTAFELIVGKAGPRGGVYLRRPEENAVFTVQSALSWQARKDVNDLRKKQLFDVAEKDLRGLTLKPAGSAPYRLERAEEGKPWSLAEGGPKDARFRFDGEHASRVARAFAELRAQRFLANGALPDAALGLGSASIRAKTATGEELTVELGNRPSADEARFAQALRDQFAAIDVDKNGKLDVSELKRTADAKDGAAREAAQALVKDPARFAAFDVGEWEGRPADRALSNEDLEAVTKNASLVPARRSGSAEVALVPSWSLDTLLVSVESLRDLSLFSYDVAKARELKIAEAGKSTLVVAKAAESWDVKTPATWPGKAPYDPKRIGPRLGELRRWRALRVAEGVTPAQAGLTTPTASVTVALDEGPPQTVAIGKPVPGKKPAEHYARGAIDSLVYVVSDTLRATLHQGPALLEKVAPPPSFGGGGQGFESLPPEVRRQLEAMQAGGGG